MISHNVEIGGNVVNKDVQKVMIDQSLDTDSDPAKIEITLARPNDHRGAYTPQESAITIYLGKNYEKEGLDLICFGHVTDTHADHSDCVVIGECDLGTLQDALPKDFRKQATNTKEVFFEVLKLHDTTISANYKAKVIDLDEITFKSGETFLDCIEMLRDYTGAIYYYDRYGILQFRDPNSPAETYNLDPYVIKPDVSKSILGYCNVIHVVGDESLVSPLEDGREISTTRPIIGEFRDQESIDLFGELVAPTDYAPHLKNQKDVQKRADMLGRFFRMYLNALTNVVVAGIAPTLQSKVYWTPFVKPLPGSVQTAIYEKTGEILPIQASGICIRRVINYSASGYEADLTISPGVNSMGEPITDADLEELTPIGSMSDAFY